MLLTLLLGHALASIVSSAGASGFTERASAAEGGEQVDVVIGVKWRNQAELDLLLRDLADPQSARFGRYLSTDEFDRRFGPASETVRGVTELLEAQGLTVTGVSRSRLFVTATGWLTDASGTRTRLIERLRELTKEPRVYCDVRGESLTLTPAIVASSAGTTVPEFRSPLRGPLLPPQSGTPHRPADIARAYGFQRLYDEQTSVDRHRENTIAIATAFGFSQEDLEAFWEQNNVQRDAAGVELRWVDGSTPEVHAESTVDVEWASAMAPAARVLVYAGPNAGADTFLKVYDRIVTENQAAIMTTSWGACEEDFGHTYLDQAHAIFQRAAAQGITVLAPSGDNGAFDCGGSNPAVDFPASDPYVLAVGGTSLQADGGEQAWLGSGGGVSRKWPAPPWQMRTEANRVLPDVAFHADPTAGFVATFNGRAAVFGGTSIAAPCWAALVALINDRRLVSARGPLGLAAPALCEVAESPEQAPASFHDVTSGDNRGYTAGPGWDFPTGWGSPRAYGLTQALSNWDAPPPAPPEVNQTMLLSPADPAATGTVRLLLSRRCLRTSLRVQARYVALGSYWLAVDGQPVASFDVGESGRLWLDLPGLDPRGRYVTVTDERGDSVFGGAFDQSPSRPTRLRLRLMNTGAIGDAAGSVVYQSAQGRERFSVRVQNLPAGPYALQLGDRTIASIVLPAERSSARIAFDSSGLLGIPLPFSPLCAAVTVVRDGRPVLRVSPVARSADHCGG